MSHRLDALLEILRKGLLSINTLLREGQTDGNNNYYSKIATKNVYLLNSVFSDFWILEHFMSEAICTS